MNNIIGERLLGRTGLRISIMGCGLIRLGGRRWGRETAGEWRNPTKREALDFLGAAVDMGTNFFDAAPAYKYSERRLGQFVAENRGKREDMIIATKCGEFYNFRSDETYRDYGAAAVKMSIETSLRRIGTYIDLMQIHSASPMILEQGEALNVMRTFQERGDVRFLGVTFSNPTQAIDIIDLICRTGYIDTIQVPYNLISRRMEQCISVAHSEGLGIITNRPMASGHLSPGTCGVLDSGHQASITEEEALSYVLSNREISIFLTGTKNIAHLRQNARVVIRLLDAWE